MKNSYIRIAIVISISCGNGISIFAQNVGISQIGSTPDNSAMLDIEATNKGTLVTRLTTVQRDAISSPANSLLIFNVTTRCFEAYDAPTSTWIAFGCIGCSVSSASAGADITLSCGESTTTLAGNTPSSGTGSWSVISGTAIITDPSSPTSGVTGLTLPGTATLRWTISNPPCTPSTDDVVINTSACFVCGNSLTDSRDGKSYNTVLVGAQCWMAENLNYGTYVPVATGGQNPANTQKYCQNLSGVNDATCPMGGLYEWAEIMDGITLNNTNATSCNGTGAPPNDKCASPIQGACPVGWHVPSHHEWTTLEKNVGSNPGDFPYDNSTTGWRGTDEGGNMKVTPICGSLPCWNTPNIGATNTSGFSAIPAGDSWANSFFSAGNSTHWWSSTLWSGSAVWFRSVDYTATAQVNRSRIDQANGYSVRCVKD